MSPVELAVQFLFQLGGILIVCRLVGLVAERLGQPPVVSEMIAGVCLGPSLIGALAPEFSAELFPKESMQVLFPVAQIGLSLYMFIIGLEFRGDIMRQRVAASMGVSLSGMTVQFGLGALVGWLIYNHTPLFPEGVPQTAAMLFMGASMCITAFPMLARILQHKGLTGTTLGTVVLGAGAIDDAAAWCMLAVVLASFTGDFTDAAFSIGGGFGYAVLVIGVVRPLLRRWARGVEERGKLSDREYAMLLALMCLGAWWTERIHLHAVFGAFVMGAAMPRGVVSKSIIARTQPLAVALFLPLFFTYSGLNTRLGLLDESGLWLIALGVLAAAVLGKSVACWGAARAAGISNREALGIGVLMNARGMMELIIINIGLERGVISPEIFAMLAIMAIVTTLMTSPILELVLRGARKLDGAPQGSASAPEHGH
jgi:Kef-type K+ transport system membrane component KefB